MRPWGGMAAPTRSPDEGGGCEHGTLCVLKPQKGPILQPSNGITQST